MTRHFLGLYLLIIGTLAAVSWGQDRLLQHYGSPDPVDQKSLTIAVATLQGELRGQPAAEARRRVAAIAGATGVRMELFAAADIVGRDTLVKLISGNIAYMQTSSGESWALKQIDAGHVLALKSTEQETRRGWLEWTLTLVFYALIALVLMIWIWPLTRDLRVLERATAQYGNRNWRFDADIKPRSQVHSLARTFKNMAARIDGLIASHKDMSNAVSHEIKTPLARMRFEIELAQQSDDIDDIRTSFGNIKADIAAIDNLVGATLSYAILERADMSLNLGEHDFSTLVPAIADFVRRDTRSDLRLRVTVPAEAGRVVCDMHLMETVLKNLLYNAARYARHEIHVSFSQRGGRNELSVDDDGPGVPEADRQRVFDSFVQLEPNGGRKAGFGLGLAIVKRTLEWHHGGVTVTQSVLGGARFCASWPSA